MMKHGSVLEKLVHNLHMYETLSIAGKGYKSIVKNWREKWMVYAVDDFFPVGTVGIVDDFDPVDSNWRNIEILSMVTMGLLYQLSLQKVY